MFINSHFWALRSQITALKTYMTLLKESKVAKSKNQVRVTSTNWKAQQSLARKQKAAHKVHHFLPFVNNTGDCKVLLQQARKMKESYCSNSNKRDYKGNTKSSNFLKTKAELNSYTEKYFKSKMKSIKKEHFNMDEFNHNVEDEDSKMSNLTTNDEDMLD